MLMTIMGWNTGMHSPDGVWLWLWTGDDAGVKGIHTLRSHVSVTDRQKSDRPFTPASHHHF